jgi:hypothetical protein
MTTDLRKVEHVDRNKTKHNIKGISIHRSNNYVRACSFRVHSTPHLPNSHAAVC